jgi:hypothetical protein
MSRHDILLGMIDTPPNYHLILACLFWECSTPMGFTLHLCILPLHIRDIRKVRKDNTSTLSLVIHRVRLKKKLAKKYISIQGGVKLRKPSFSWVSHCISVFSWAPPLLLHRFSLLLLVQVTIIPLEPCALNAEIQHFVLSFSISYRDLIKFPYFADTTKRGVKRRPNERVKPGWLYGYLYCNQSFLHWF